MVNRKKDVYGMSSDTSAGKAANWDDITQWRKDADKLRKDRLGPLVTDPIFGNVWIKENENNPNAQHLDLTGYYCGKPFIHFEVEESGVVHICCPSFLPYPVGNLLNEDVEQIWNGLKARTIRQSILEGNYRYCIHSTCPSIQSGLTTLDHVEKFKKDIGNRELIEEELNAVQNYKDDKLVEDDLKISLPSLINFTNDRSCNLQCPSCRVGKILHTEGAMYDKVKKINDKMVKAFLTEPTDRKFVINVTGSGDPFASRIYRDMLYNLDGSKFPNLSVDLQTNGTLFTEKMWHKLNKIHDNLGHCQVSFDAGTKETYEKVRVGGDWDLLLKNCDFLDKMSEQYKKFDISYHYVVQTANYKEMSTFVDLILNRYKNYSYVHFVIVNDWGTWSKQGKEVYESKCMWKTTHPEYEQFLDVLRDPIFSERKVHLGNLTASRKLALGNA